MTVFQPILELVYRDASGSHAAVTIGLQSGTTVADADVGASALASALASLTGGVLVRQRLRYKVTNDAISAAAIGSSVKRAGVFIFDCAGDEHQALISVPSISEDVIVTVEPGAGVLIDITLSAVSDYISELIAQGVTDPFANAIVSLVTAYRQSRV